jgi:hypothetical protein
MFAEITIPTWLVGSLEIILLAIAGLVTALIGLATQRIIVKMNASEAEKQGLLALQAGIISIEETVKEKVVSAMEDGIITSEEASNLRQAAYDKAIEVAKGPGKDFLIALGKERVVPLIEKLLAGMKTDGVVK